VKFGKKYSLVTTIQQHALGLPHLSDGWMDC